MSSQERALRLGLSTDLSDYLRALRVVCTALGRAACLAVAIFLLAAVRGGHPSVVQAVFYVVALGSIYLALGGTSFRTWVWYLTGFVLFAQLRGYADEIGTPTQFDYPVTMERALFFGEIPSIWLQDRFYTFARLGILETYTIGIYLSYFFLPHILAFALWRWDRERFKTYVFAFMATIYIGLLTCVILPTAPPWMASQLGYIPHVYQVFPDIAGEVTPGTYERGYEIAGANPVAAMPSLHSAIPFLMAIALWNHRWWRWAGVAYAASMLLAVVYLGEHYAVDAFAGWAAAAGCWVGVRALQRRFSKPQDNAEDAQKTGASAPLSEAPVYTQVTRG